MASTDHFEHEVIDVPEDVLQQVRDDFEAGRTLLESATEKGIGAEHAAWIGSYSAIVDRLDPLGEDFSKSLRENWYRAKWFNGTSPKDRFQYAIVFGQQVAVVKSILTGRVKVVKHKSKGGSRPASSSSSEERPGVGLRSGGHIMEVFISHSSADFEIAKRLVTLIRSALNLSADRIRCTSVDGFRLPVGAPISEVLRQEIHETKAMIVILTPHSIKSSYVLFELGARWGAKRPMLPLLARGVDSDALDGPLAAINALACDSEDQVRQFIEDLSQILERPTDRASAYSKCIREVVEESLKS